MQSFVLFSQCRKLNKEEKVISMREKNLETYSLVWLDPSLNSCQEKINVQGKLRSSINCLKTFIDTKQCEDFIESTCYNDRIIFIVNGQLGKQIIPRIHRLRQISCIYIFCVNREKHQIWANQFKKVNLSSLPKQNQYIYIYTGVAKIIDPLFVLTKHSNPISKKHSCIDHLCASNVQ